ncbi:MAG: DUF4406 domain-containing protein [bacterium]|nr:DUF4406 domain-containing protein [bacterium]
MHTYLAGPMRGHHLFNFPAFFAAALALRGVGHEVVNPAERDMAHGIDPTADEFSKDFDLTGAFKFDFQSIIRCGNVVLLEGWRESHGVAAELVVAKLTGARIFEFDSSAGDLLREIDLAEPTITWPEQASEADAWEQLTGEKVAYTLPREAFESIDAWQERIRTAGPKVTT